MREIKFRAWHKPFKDNDFGAGYKYGNNVISFHDMSPEKYELEQYTGRVDAHGTKIFEGDIVQLNHDGHDWFGYQESIAITNKVIFDAGAFWIGDEPIYTYPSEDMQVVGSIHENPELLDVEK